MRHFLIAGNWKMNKTASEGVSLVESLLALASPSSSVEVVLAPPFTAIPAVAHVLSGQAGRFALAAQNVFWEERGAFTGEISPAMLADLGCRYVIVGHSERRHLLGETDDMVNKKVHALLRHGLRPILCVGETKAERQQGRTHAVVARHVTQGLDRVSAEQMKLVTLAYEPVWAIGTGDAATPDQAAEVHRHIRALVASHWSTSISTELRILYGGSVTAGNVAQYLASPEVNGALVGGACLDADGFAKIIRIADSII